MRDHDSHGAPGFVESLTSAVERGEGEDEQAMKQEEAREAAEQLVASALLQPMFEQLREGQFEADFLKPRPGRDAFEQKLHTRLADDMVQRMDLPIVDAVTRFVTKDQGGASSQPGMEVDRHG